MYKKLLFLTVLISLAISCSAKDEQFQYFSEKFADIYIARYEVPGFENLPLEKKQLLFYMYQAALSGRDIFYDQNYEYNLRIRRTLEAIVRDYEGDREAPEFKKFMVYTKRVWFSSGIHHHYGMTKIIPDFPQEYFRTLIMDSPNGEFPLEGVLSRDDLLTMLLPIMYDPGVAPKKVNLAQDVDQITASAVNFYENVTQSEVEAYYAGMADNNDLTPVSFGLNSKLVKMDGNLVEIPWWSEGMYGAAIKQIVFWLEKAVTVAENDLQQKALEKLIAYYNSGSLEDFDDYNVAWVQDIESDIDLINGFIEVYDDPLGIRASYESVVQLVDSETSKRIAAIGKEAQWFEDNSPLIDAHKKKKVKGIIANVVNVVVESGATSPGSPIGINLPNSSWIRKEHGSKSVSLGNIIDAYRGAGAGNGFIEEFAYSAEEIKLSKEYGNLAGNLATDMHEVIGHASGQLEPGVGTTRETMKSYASALEEGRADLVGLYFIMDPKLVEIGVMPNLDVGKAQYNGYIRNGMMTQLTRIEPGNEIEESHMRNRQMNSQWAYEMGLKNNVIERVNRNGKTYFIVNDYEALRELFGQLLREIQRIKSQGDYEAGKALVETYGVKVDAELHAEVLERYAKLDIAPYGGMINPMLKPVMNGDQIVDVTISYPENFTLQMMHYAEHYSFLPTVN